MSRWTLLFLTTLLCAAPAAAQQIRGDVRDVATGEPIEGAVLTGIALESFVSRGTMRAVEVYHNPAQAPGEYQRPFMKCGVVLIWTDYGFGFEVPFPGGAGVQDSGASVGADPSSPAQP